MSQFPQFLEAVLEGFVDGILVLSEKGSVIYSSALARRICHQLNQRTSFDSLPDDIWQVCQALIESRELYGRRTVVLESELTIEQLSIRLRVQWLDVDDTESYLLVRLEDKYQASQRLALSESRRFGLTPRETEVWMLRRSGYSRKDIAAQLYITLDTVKKHLKNIQAKKQAILEEDAWDSRQVS